MGGESEGEREGRERQNTELGGRGEEREIQELMSMLFVV